MSNFIQNLIEQDILTNKWQGRVTTRFPPEPNGYLHIGHAKSIHTNFGLANRYGGVCHLRFDDTNPEKESDIFVNSIIDSVQWLGFNWRKQNTEYLFYTSDYFEKIYELAYSLVKHGYAYVDSQDNEQIRRTRGSLTVPGQISPFRSRSIPENLDLFEKMRAGKFTDGEHVLRAKIDMESPNMNMRDPIIYRIRHITHHRTNNKWCIYPMYDFAHCVSDAIENITHSICTLEFQDHQQLYNWFLHQLAKIKQFLLPLPQQIEFARLKLTYTVTSKRKLNKLVQLKYIDGWDDPRLPTIMGLRRRGYTPSAIKLFCERIGISKANVWIDTNVLEQALRDDLNLTAPRAIAVLNPLKLIIENFPQNLHEWCNAPIHPNYPERGQRNLLFTRELWIERDDFMEYPSKGFFRLFPGNKVRLRYGFVIEHIKTKKNITGDIIAIYCKYFPDSKSGTVGSNLYKVKGNIHWISTINYVKAEIRLYEHLLTKQYPDENDQNFIDSFNKNAKTIVQAYIEPSIRFLNNEGHVQFERNGYFVVDYIDSTPLKLVFNRTVSLKGNTKKSK